MSTNTQYFIDLSLLRCYIISKSSLIAIDYFGEYIYEKLRFYECVFYAVKQFIAFKKEGRMVQLRLFCDWLKKAPRPQHSIGHNFNQFQFYGYKPYKKQNTQWFCLIETRYHCSRFSAAHKMEQHSISRNLKRRQF